MRPNGKKSFGDQISDIPADFSSAIRSAWIGRERGLAVFAGVFLASLVITTVFAYGVGLSQGALQNSLNDEVYDAKVDFSSQNDCPREQTTLQSGDQSVTNSSTGSR